MYPILQERFPFSTAENKLPGIMSIYRLRRVHRLISTTAMGISSDTLSRPLGTGSFTTTVNGIGTKVSTNTASEKTAIRDRKSVV